MTEQMDLDGHLRFINGMADIGAYEVFPAHSADQRLHGHHRRQCYRCGTPKCKA